MEVGQYNIYDLNYSIYLFYLKSIPNLPVNIKTKIWEVAR
jgi:hypothetical protein